MQWWRSSLTVTNISPRKCGVIPIIATRFRRCRHAFGKVPYNFNTLPNTTIWFGSNSISVPDAWVSSVGPTTIPRVPVLYTVPNTPFFSFPLFMYYSCLGIIRCISNTPYGMTLPQLVAPSPCVPALQYGDASFYCARFLLPSGRFFVPLF